MAKTLENGGRRWDRLWRTMLWGGIVILMLIPVVAMRFTDEVSWTLSDFIFAGGVLGVAGGVCEPVMWKSGVFAFRVGAGLALLASVGLFWVTGAVGIIGSENEPVNLLYFGVIAIASIGAILARFRAGNLAATMIVAAVAQIGIAVFALMAGYGTTGAGYPRDIIGGTVVFTLLWLFSASLFWVARSHERPMAS